MSLNRYSQIIEHIFFTHYSPGANEVISEREDILVALLDPKHIAHADAYGWLAANLTTGWATCPLCENGCLRVMTNPRYTTPQAPVDVLAKLEKSADNRHHEFWPDDLSITNATLFNRGCLQDINK